jgi:hypothetical protein
MTERFPHEGETIFPFEIEVDVTGVRVLRIQITNQHQHMGLLSPQAEAEIERLRRENEELRATQTKPTPPHPTNQNKTGGVKYENDKKDYSHNLGSDFYINIHSLSQRPTNTHDFRRSRNHIPLSTAGYCGRENFSAGKRSI